MNSELFKRMVWQLPELLGGILVLVMPLSLFWPLGQPAASGILPMYVTPGVYFTDVAAGLLIAACGIRSARLWNGANFRSQTANLKIVLPLLALVVLGFLSIPWALSPGLALYTTLRWLLALGVYLAWLSLTAPVEKFILPFMLGLGLQCLIGGLQFATKSPLGIPGELALAIDQPRAAVIWLEGSNWLRAYGLTFHPNVLGGFLAAGLILGLPYLQRGWVRILWLVLGIGLVLTFSRSAWMAAAVTLPLAAGWIAMRRPEMRRALLLTLGIAGAAGVIVGIILFQPIVSRLNIAGSFSEYTSLSGRGELIGLSLQTILHRPLNGIGAGNFPLAALSPAIHDVAHSVHLVALLLAAEVGLAGGFLWYILWLAPVFGLEKWLRGNAMLPVATAAAWFALGLVGLWDSYPWSLEAGRLFAVTLLAWCVKSGITAGLSQKVGPKGFIHWEGKH